MSKFFFLGSQSYINNILLFNNILIEKIVLFRSQLLEKHKVDVSSQKIKPNTSTLIDFFLLTLEVIKLILKFFFGSEIDT